jgi:uncharacterized protein YbaR (Trm112 family)
MQFKSGQPMQIDQTVADLLACPVCHGGLRLEAERLACGGCARRYPVVNGIPVLIAERAEKDPRI